jgi:protoheme IX farnesyltransferase
MIKWLVSMWELTKPRLTRLVVLTCLFGAAVAPGALSALQWFALVFGCWAVVAAANALNCYMERDVDALMSRTKDRPLASGKMSASSAFLAVWVLLLSGTVLLHGFLNPLSALLGLVGFALYVWVYTPLKRVSMSALFVGAIPGAIPPVIGWAAVTQSIDLGAWILFAMLFFWQLPHFVSISLHWGQDYSGAGIKTISGSLGQELARRHMVVYSGLLVGVSLLPAFFNMAGSVYLWTSIVCGVGFSALSLGSLFKWRELNWNRIVFIASIVYLPVVLGVWVLEVAAR